ncbi:MAG: methyltransferase [Angelakisella sp.]
MSDTATHFEPLGDYYRILVSKAHKFGTDAFLLSRFAQVHKGEKCCDLGSGCGIIPLLWFRWEQDPLYAYAVELQEQGYRQMLTTVAENKLEEKLRPIHSDLNNLKGSIENCSLDVVTCNPPYKRNGHGVPCPDETRLTARHEVACSLDDVCTAAAKLLRYGGRLCLCQRPERLPDIMEAMRRAKLEPKRLRFVQQHPHTAPWLILIEGKKGGKPFLRVEPPLIVEKVDGGFSDEMLEIYGK